MIRIELEYYEFEFLKKYLKFKLEQQEYILGNKLGNIDKKEVLEESTNYLHKIVYKLDKINMKYDKELESEKNAK